MRSTTVRGGWVLVTLGLMGCGRSGFDSTTLDSGPTVDAAPVDPSLVSHFAMDDDPTDGDLDDATGTRRAVCLVGVTCGTRTDGKTGNALHLQDQQFYRLLYDAALAADGAFTIAVWVRAGTANAAYAATKRYGQIYNTWGIVVGDTGNVEFEGAFLNVTPRSKFLRTAVPISVGAWMHLTVSYDGAVRSAYINGFRVVSDNITLIADASELLIGADEDDGTVFGHFVGDLDDLRIYNRSLGDAEIMTLATP